MAAQQSLSQGMASGPLQGGNPIAGPPLTPIDVILNPLDWDPDRLDVLARDVLPLVSA